MKVLFLDVDGVLNSRPYVMGIVSRGEDGWAWAVDPAAVGRLLPVLERTGASVVLSSGWRDYPEHTPKLTESGIVIHDTLALRGGSHRHAPPRRCDEIALWLAEHPEVGQFAIVDDDDDAGALHPDRFVLTHWNEGLTDDHADALEGLLR